MKEIIYYTNAYKTHFYLSGTTEYAYVIERYFMNLDLHQITLRRLNFKYFNFKESKITGDCLFHQCKFDDTNMLNVQMDGVQFTLCEFLDVKDFTMKFLEKHSNQFLVVFDCCVMSQCSITSQAICFNNCKIDGIRLDLIGERTVVFENCFIKNLHIHIQNNHKSNPPTFTKCIFENIPTISPFSENEIKRLILKGKSII